MTGIKICGITNVRDALAASEYGADALGFIFYPKSPRYVSPETSKRIIERLPHKTIAIGVFVDHNVQELKEIVKYCGLNLVQLHGDESPEYCSQFPKSILIKAFSLRRERDLHKLKNYPVKAILVDTYDPDSYGGTGKTSNWELAKRVKDTHPLILSGGLNPSNIVDAIKYVYPHAVDINSGVEKSPREKDVKKIEKIIQIIRTNDASSLSNSNSIFHDTDSSRYLKDRNNRNLKLKMQKLAIKVNP